MFNEEITPEYIPGKTDYSGRELELMADEMLREDAKRDLCRICLQEGVEKPFGEKTGVSEPRPQTKRNGHKIMNGDGLQKMADTAQLRCAHDHVWFQGEGSEYGFKRTNQVLMDEHLIARKKREVYLGRESADAQNGAPEPSIVSGIYWRSHPNGRKINSETQRQKNSASWFR